jgi:carboxyl-terminal processing protease
MDQMAISALISGPAGSKVSLDVLRQGKELSFTMFRDNINIASVRSELKTQNIGYIRISQFQERTATDLLEHMHRLYQQGAKAWLLDLRNNPGGLINSGVAVADAFLTKGTIVTTQGRLERGNMIYEADPNDPSHNLPTIVLINHGSASAAEIVAAALQENRRAQLAGQMSFGKGSVQSVISLDDNRSIKLTTAYYYTPNGRNLNNDGIKPDYELSGDDASQESQEILSQAIKLLQKRL